MAPAVCCAAGPVVIGIDRAKPINKQFQGVGFQVTSHLYSRSEREMDEIFVKRWRELSPALAWVAYTGEWDWDTVVPYLKRVLGPSRICITSVDLPDPKRESPDAFARRFAGDLERLIRREGVANIAHCSIGGRWPGFVDPGSSLDSARLDIYSSKLAEEIAERKLGVDLIGHAGNIDPANDMVLPGVTSRTGASAAMSCALLRDWHPRRSSSRSGDGLRGELSFLHPRGGGGQRPPGLDSRPGFASLDPDPGVHVPHPLRRAMDKVNAEADNLIQTSRLSPAA